ncbi:Molybdopterin biosynthesis MoaE [Hypoxylon trugodes]|uniref:Molybdopterin biosynthesis MoaE n=1 Tax=Hypoxylon trugodes TaxID=326681 RepID=UPI00219141B4|nr:Molybdopterin biosynthesis MoaE [Hypoxylon trugodes]KAI1392248.1 Molybdopterin biosynthesis MoaE [Hypoxylon trugodes]
MKGYINILIMCIIRYACGGSIVRLSGVLGILAFRLIGLEQLLIPTTLPLPLIDKFLIIRYIQYNHKPRSQTLKPPFSFSDSHTDVEEMNPETAETIETIETANVEEDDCYVGLTRNCLNPNDAIDRVRSPHAGAIVMFAGTTRDNFGGKPVKELQYSAYSPLALRTMLSICKNVRAEHGLIAIAMVHRLGIVPIGEESILIAVSAPHRQAAWRAGEQALEDCKERVEVWKREEFEGEDGVWKANRDGAAGHKILHANKTPSS